MMQRYRSVFIDQSEQNESKKESTENSEAKLDPETLYFYKQKQDFKSILWLDTFSRIFYIFSYFLFLGLYWKMYNKPTE